MLVNNSLCLQYQVLFLLRLTPSVFITVKVYSPFPDCKYSMLFSDVQASVPFSSLPPPRSPRATGGRGKDVMSAALHTGRPRRRSHAESLVQPDIVVDVDGPAYHAFHLGEIHAVAVEEPPVLYGVVHPLGQCVVQRVARLRHAEGRLHAAQGVDVFLRAVL